MTKAVLNRDSTLVTPERGKKTASTALLLTPNSGLQKLPNVAILALAGGGVFWMVRLGTKTFSVLLAQTNPINQMLVMTRRLSKG